MLFNMWWGLYKGGGALANHSITSNVKQEITFLVSRFAAAAAAATVVGAAGALAFVESTGRTYFCDLSGFVKVVNTSGKVIINSKILIHVLLSLTSSSCSNSLGLYSNVDADVFP